MNANLNPISSQLPNVKSDVKPDIRFDNKARNEKIDAHESSFGSLLSHAEKKEVAPPKRETPVAKHEMRENSINESHREDVSEVRGPKSVKETGSSEDSVEDDKVEKLTLKKPSSHRKEIQDDKSGVVAKSYDGMAVSYPVSRIAKDSLDEKTLKVLDDQGLTNLPTFVMVQPSKAFMNMKNALEGKVSIESAVPVAKPIAQFMASLENELGVKPDRLVQAFKKLAPGQLALPPEKTMAQVVKNLNLSPKDQAKASELFTKMLAQMKKAQNELMAPMMLQGAGAGVVAATVTEKAEENGVVTKNKTQTAVARYVQNSKDGAEKVVSSDSGKEVFVLPKEQSAAPQMKDASLSKETVTKDATSPVQNQDTYSSKFAVPKEMTPVQPQAQQAAPNAQVLAAPQVGASQAQMAAAPLIVANQGDSEKSMKKESKLDSKTEVKNVSSTANQNPLSTQVDTTPAKPGVTGQPLDVAGGGAAGEMKANNDVKHEAIRSIINNAQMLAAKGGGEMRMTLKPDHLGEIQLKVAMEGNRVNVQMTAERGEVKKLIEQNVHELRHGLASHNLSMEKLDVSVANRDTSGFKGQPNFGAARDFAQQFHQNQSNKREFMESIAGLRTNAHKSMNTIDRATQVQSMRSRDPRSGRLNVVA